jgi:hypothetical protein
MEPFGSSTHNKNKRNKHTALDPNLNSLKGSQENKIPGWKD